MKKTRLFRLVGCLCLIIVIAAIPFLGGCASEKEPTKTTATTTPASQTHDIVTLEIYSNPFGKAGYVLSFALADLVNKNSTWLRAVTIETPSASANLNILQRSPEKSGVWVGYVGPLQIEYCAQGNAPFTPEKPFEMDIKAVSLAVNIVETFLTTDPNIKTPQDLVGKTMAIETVGSTNEFLPKLFLEHWGIADKVKLVTMSISNQGEALQDGTIDVGRQGSVILGNEEYSDWSPTAPFEALCMAKPTYIFPVSDEDLAQVMEKTNYPLYSIGAKAKTIGKATFEDWKSVQISNGWFVSADMPDDVVTELTRIIYENAELFKDYHANGTALTKQSIGGVAVPRDGYHPAAIKYLEAKGTKVGR